MELLQNDEAGTENRVHHSRAGTKVLTVGGSAAAQRAAMAPRLAPGNNGCRGEGALGGGSITAGHEGRYVTVGQRRNGGSGRNGAGGGRWIRGLSYRRVWDRTRDKRA